MADTSRMGIAGHGSATDEEARLILQLTSGVEERLREMHEVVTALYSRLSPILPPVIPGGQGEEQDKAPVVSPLAFRLMNIGNELTHRTHELGELVVHVEV